MATDDTKRPWWKRWWGITGIGLVLLVAVAGFAGGTADEEPATAEATTEAASPTPTPTPEPTFTPTMEATEAEEPDRSDTLSRAACEHWRNVLGDIQDGVLTDEEIRAKVQEVNADAQYSDAPGIADASRDLLAAATSDPSGFSDAAIAFSDACVDTGSL